MYDCSIWTHTGNSWETETNKIFLLAGKHRVHQREGEKREKREFKENHLLWVRCTCVPSRGRYTTIK